MLKIDEKKIKVFVILFLTSLALSFSNANITKADSLNYDLCKKDTFINRYNVKNLDFLPKNIIINFSNSQKYFLNGPNTIEQNRDYPTFL